MQQDGRRREGLHIRYRRLRSARVEDQAKENPPIGRKGGCDLGVSPCGSISESKRDCALCCFVSP